MPAERRGQAIRVMIALVNWQQEEPNGCGGGQQLLLNGTSRVNREIYARFCERLGVKFPGPTRRQWATTVPTATASPNLGARFRFCFLRVRAYGEVRAADLKNRGP